MVRVLALTALLLATGCRPNAGTVTTQSSEVEYQEGLQAFEQKNYEAAARLFDNSLRRGGLNADLSGMALLMRAKSCIRLGRFDDALHDLEDAGNGPVPPEEVLAAKGEIALKQGDLDKARVLYADARSINPAMPLPEKLK